MSNIKVPYSELLQNPQQAEILTTYELKEDKMPKAWYPKSVKTMIKLQFTRVVKSDGKNCGKLLSAQIGKLHLQTKIYPQATSAGVHLAKSPT